MVNTETKVQIDRQLFLDLVVYFSCIDDPTDQEKSINDRLSDKLRRMAAREEYAASLKNNNTGA